MPVFKRPHFEKVLALAEKGRIAPLYLFLGAPSLAQELLRRLLKHLSNLGHQVETVDLAETPFEALWQQMKTPPLLGRRIFYVKNSSSILKEVDFSFTEHLERHKTWLTLCLALEKLAENHPLYLFALERGVLMPLPEAKERDILRYELPELLATFGKNMEQKVAKELISLVGEDLEALTQEITKLSLYVGERQVIELEDVWAVVSPRPESAPYALLEAFWREGLGGVQRVLKELLSQGIYPLVIVVTLFTFFKRLYLIKELLTVDEGLSKARRYESFKPLYTAALKKHFPERTPKALNVHPYAAFKAALQAQKIPLEAFGAIFKKLLEIDAKLKRGGLAEEEIFAFFVFLKGLIQAPQGL